MSLFRVYVDGVLFYHPQMSKLAITDARIEEDAENIDSMTLSAPFNHPYLSAVRPLASTIVCKKGDAVVFEGRALDNGTDFYNTHTWTCESCLIHIIILLCHREKVVHFHHPYIIFGDLQHLFKFRIFLQRLLGE